MLTCLKIRICFKKENVRSAVTVLTYKDVAAQHCMQPADCGSGQRCAPPLRAAHPPTRWPQENYENLQFQAAV